MYERFCVEGFRCFRALTIGPLGRVNLIAGCNNAGKTALLEALFLHVGWHNPNLPTLIDVFRGIVHFDLTPDGLWGWTFPDHDLGARARFAAALDDGTRTVLTLELAQREDIGVDPAKGALSTQLESSRADLTSAQRELVLTYEGPGGHVSRAKARVETPQGHERAQIRVYLDPETRAETQGIFIPVRSAPGDDDAHRFSDLSKRRKTEGIVRALAILEPRLRGLELGLQGGTAVIYGDVGLSQLLPLPLMGAGMVRLCSILLAIASAEGGMVLIDEIDNGFYHGVLDDVWRAIIEAARAAHVQVFATTHSLECIRTAHAAALYSPPYELGLHRLEWAGDDVRAVTYDQETLETAIEEGLEVR